VSIPRPAVYNSGNLCVSLICAHGRDDGEGQSQHNRARCRRDDRHGRRRPDGWSAEGKGQEQQECSSSARYASTFPIDSMLFTQRRSNTTKWDM
jgi:hypothetical protein